MKGVSAVAYRLHSFSLVMKDLLRLRVEGLLHEGRDAATAGATATATALQRVEGQEG